MTLLENDFKDMKELKKFDFSFNFQ